MNSTETLRTVLPPELLFVFVPEFDPLPETLELFVILPELLLFEVLELFDFVPDDELELEAVLLPSVHTQTNPKWLR